MRSPCARNSQEAYGDCGRRAVSKISIAIDLAAQFMARKYILDTNVYIDAVRDAAKEGALDAFLERNAPVTYMSAVVMQELRTGAVTAAQASGLDKGILGVFERRVRVAALSWAAFKGCCRILASHIRQDGLL